MPSFKKSALLFFALIVCAAASPTQPLARNKAGTTGRALPNGGLDEILAARSTGTPVQPLARNKAGTTGRALPNGENLPVVLMKSLLLEALGLLFSLLLATKLAPLAVLFLSSGSSDYLFGKNTSGICLFGFQYHVNEHRG
ncbi:hypothetical protein K435DRAFT_803689 [Dendrothele bispora CBS 962.96]|uniref:Uncharacterized protein n=1 Tax=Dendrothele bispora (strain CBS 962.96) TaxID=1314807 RepID=A0A4S8LGU0_DENBC|nr:hypothetical protein K435DRAFT_803689 [Dendrothele bispora CBS 962.96]